ncbi:hypothetical protein D3C73_278290 [compost metagenome]
MGNPVLNAYNEMSKAKYEADEALSKLEATKKEYCKAQINSCIDGIMNIQKEDGKLTERDLKIFLNDLVTNVVSNM